MKNLMYLSVVALMMSCGTTEETEIVVQPVTEENVVEDTTVEETFDVTEIETVGELLDTLETIEPVINE
jgi:hypothetical protein